MVRQEVMCPPSCSLLWSVTDTVVVACDVARVKEWLAGVILSWKFMLVALPALVPSIFHRA